MKSASMLHSLVISSPFSLLLSAAKDHLMGKILTTGVSQTHLRMSRYLLRCIKGWSLIAPKEKEEEVEEALEVMEHLISLTQPGLLV